jgi:hypothetical protein
MTSPANCERPCTHIADLHPEAYWPHGARANLAFEPLVAPA